MDHSILEHILSLRSTSTRSKESASSEAHIECECQRQFLEQLCGDEDRLEALLWVIEVELDNQLRRDGKTKELAAKHECQLSTITRRRTRATQILNEIRNLFEDLREVLTTLIG